MLRLSAGGTILVFNGRDGEWQAAIAGRKRPDHLEVVARTRPQDRLADLTYAFAPLKHARLDYMVQKAVEMGASHLLPVLTRFTQVTRVNGMRMRANVIEAAEQCGILSIAAVAEPLPLERWLGQREGRRLLIFCDEAAETANPAAALQARACGSAWDRCPDRPGRRVCRGRAGPAAAAAADLEAFPGTADLRADTAAVAALALVQAVLGDWTGPGKGVNRLPAIKPFGRSWSKPADSHAKGCAKSGANAEIETRDL